MASSITRPISLSRRKTETKSLSLPTGFALALAAVGLISLLYLAQASAVATAGYNLKRLEEQRAQIVMKNEQLRIKIAQLQSLGRIESEAATRLKMGPPAKVLYVPVSIKATATDNSSTTGLNARYASNATNRDQSAGKAQAEDSWWNALRRAFGL